MTNFNRQFRYYRNWRLNFVIFAYCNHLNQSIFAYCYRNDYNNRFPLLQVISITISGYFRDYYKRKYSRLMIMTKRLQRNAGPYWPLYPLMYVYIFREPVVPIHDPVSPANFILLVNIFGWYYSCRRYFPISKNAESSWSKNNNNNWWILSTSNIWIEGLRNSFASETKT